MSKARGPLYSLQARGTIGKKLIFQGGPGLTRIKRYVKPVQPNTQSQIDKRTLVRQGVLRWQWFINLLKSYWNEAIKNTNKVMSGYNYFLSEYLKSMIVGETPSLFPRYNLYTHVPILDGLISWWKFNEGQGNDLADSEDANPGINHGAAWVNGIIGYALSFNGTSDYVSIVAPDGGNLDPDTISIEMWVKANNNTSDGVMYTREPWADNCSVFQQQNYWNFAIDTSDDGGSRIKVGTIPGDLIVSQWQHIVFTYNGSEMKAYLNGVLVNSGAQSGLINNHPGNTHAYIGCKYRDPPTWPIERCFDGGIDEVRIYNRALSEQEVLNNYTLRS